MAVITFMKPSIVPGLAGLDHHVRAVRELDDAIELAGHDDEEKAAAVALLDDALLGLRDDLHPGARHDDEV